MPMHVRVSGSWKKITQPAVRVSGSWKDITEGYVKVSGVWKQLYGHTFDITYGSGGGNATGYSNGTTPSDPGGSISPLTIKGQTIRGLYTLDSTNSLFLYINGNRPQNFFSTLSCESGLFNSDNANDFEYQSSPDYTVWRWDLFSSPLFPSSGSGKVIFYD